MTWSVVLLANLVGAFACAVVAARTSVFDPAVVSAFREIGHRAMEPGFHDHSPPRHSRRLADRVDGLAGMPGAESARLWVIVLITYVVGIGEFSHVIAGSTEVLVLVASGEETFVPVPDVILVPTLLGNVIGGVSLVAAFAHGQFVTSEEV